MLHVGIIKNAKSKDLKKYDVKNGVKITQLIGGYAENFAREGIKNGDIITTINGIKVSSVEEVQNIVKNRDFNQPLSVVLVNSLGKTFRYGLR